MDNLFKLIDAKINPNSEYKHLLCHKKEKVIDTQNILSLENIQNNMLGQLKKLDDGEVRKSGKLIPSEYEEQCAVVEYLELLKRQGRVKVFSAIPSSTWTTSWGQKIKNQKMGVRKGVPDLIIILHDKILFLEMKKKKGGVISEEQKEWINSINMVGAANDGFYIIAKCCCGFDEAKLFLDMNL